MSFTLFIDVVLLCLKRKFNLSATWSYRFGTAETQPTDGFWPPALHHRLDNINRQWGVYFCDEFLGLLQFLQMFYSYVAIFSFKLLQSQHGNGKNSAHRLSLASCPTPPPCQHQWAVACLI